MPLLRNIIYKRWPNSRSECTLQLCDFWNFREDRTIQDGIILKCDRNVVPRAHANPRYPKSHPRGPPWGEKNTFAEPVQLCIGQESQMPLTNFLARVKLARNTRRANGTTAVTRAVM